MSKIIQSADLALHLLRSGAVVGLPTETVYGLAADATLPEAIEKIYALKARPLSKHLALNIHPSWPITNWCEHVPKYVTKLIQNFWPGPLTLILRLKPNTLPRALEGPQLSIALRCPNHPKTLYILEHLGHPLVAPSANPSHDLSASRADQVAAYFSKSDLCVLEGGPSVHGIESTILSATDENDCQILRQGAISLNEIRQCLGFAPRIHESPTNQSRGNFFYFFEEADLKDYLSQNPGLKFCLIGQNVIFHHFPQAIQTFDLGPLPEQCFYTLCHHALKLKPSALMIQAPDPSIHPGLFAQIKKFAKLLPHRS